jgi:hypothetical protein
MRHLAIVEPDVSVPAREALRTSLICVCCAAIGSRQRLRLPCSSAASANHCAKQVSPIATCRPRASSPRSSQTLARALPRFDARESVFVTAMRQDITSAFRFASRSSDFRGLTSY